jgi:two-component system chemotaxis response regulator CheB
LPQILKRAGRLPAAHPRDGEPIERGRIYIPPPDHHLLIEDECVRIVRGPKENGHRPALDPMFRTAAVNYGRRVVGVVLTGMLDDGTAGLLAIKRLGGVAVAQNPGEALFPGMPMSAIANVDVDHVLHLDDIPPLLARLAREPVTEPPLPVPEQMMTEANIARMDEGALDEPRRPGVPSGLNCPECHGTLFEITDGKIKRYRCRVGHAYSIETLHADQSQLVEAALWSAVVALREKAVLARRMMRYMSERGHQLSASRFEEDVKDAEQRAKVIQDLLERGAAGNGRSRDEAASDARDPPAAATASAPQTGGQTSQS